MRNSCYSELPKSINKPISNQLGLITFFENNNQLATIKKTGTERRLSNFRFIPGEFEAKDMVRSKVGSFIVMDKDRSYIPITNFALSEIFFGNKKLVGLPALWLAVLYFYLKEKSDCFEPNETAIDNESNAAFMEAFKVTLIGRLKSDSSLITLSGPEENIEPNLTCPLDIALWYCVISPELYTHGTNNRLRGVVTKYHLKLLDLLGYPYPKEWTIRQLLRYQIFAVMMREEKENSVNLRNWLRCLYQNSMRLEDGSIILLDGNSSLKPELFRVRIERINPNTKKEKKDYLHELPIAKSACENNQRHTQKSTLKLIKVTALDKTSDEYRDSLPIKELFALEKLLDKNKTLGDITIPNNLIVEPIPEPKTNYDYSDNQKFDCEDALYKEFIRNKAYLNTSRSELIEYIKDPKTRDKIIKLKQNEISWDKFIEPGQAEIMKDGFIKDLMEDSIRKKFIKHIATLKIRAKFTEYSQEELTTRKKFIKSMETQITRDEFINYLMKNATISYRHIKYMQNQKIKGKFIKDLIENLTISDKFVKYLQKVPKTKSKLMTYLENPDTVDEFTKSIPNPRASRNELISYKPDSTTKDEFIKYIVDKQKNKAKNPKDTLPKNIENIVEKVISDYSAKIKTSPSLAKAGNTTRSKGFFAPDEGTSDTSNLSEYLPFHIAVIGYSG